MLIKKWVWASARYSRLPSGRRCADGRTAGRYACPRPKSGKFSNSRVREFSRKKFETVFQIFMGYWKEKQ